MAACVPIFSLGMPRNVQKSAFNVLLSPSFNKFPFLSFNFDCVLKLNFLAYRGWPSNRLYHSFFLSVIPLKFS